MSDPKLPGDDSRRGGVSRNRIIIWIVVGAVGVYLVVSGLVGVLSK